MKRITVPFVLLNLFCLTQLCYGQRNDANLWASVTLQKQASPKFLVHFRQAARIGQNITQLNYSFSDIGVTYKLSKNIKTSLDYRFISKLNKTQELSLRHRLYWTLTLKKKIKPFTLVYRHRIQYQLEDVNSSETGDVPRYYTRSKITLKYDLNRFTPYVASELFTKIVDWDQLVSKKYRLFAGCSYMFNKTDELNLYYLIDKRINQKNPLTNYVIGVAYTHTFY
ncbi:MAG: DUF2490 domain-containing protein [Bacteroidota bacterium]